MTRLWHSITLPLLLLGLVAMAVIVLPVAYVADAAWNRRAGWLP